MANDIVTGVMKFYNRDAGFGYIETNLGDVHIGRNAVGRFAGDLVPMAEITCSYMRSDRGLTVVEVHSVADSRSDWMLGMVSGLQQKRAFGFIQCGELKKPAFLHLSVVPHDVTLTERTPVRFRCVTTKKGQRVTDVEVLDVPKQKGRKKPSKPRYLSGEGHGRRHQEPAYSRDASATH